MAGFGAKDIIGAVHLSQHWAWTHVQGDSIHVGIYVCDCFCPFSILFLSLLSLFRWEKQQNVQISLVLLLSHILSKRFWCCFCVVFFWLLYFPLWIILRFSCLMVKAKRFNEKVEWMTETRPQGAQQDLLVKISVLLILSHSESCVPTARPEHLLHGGRRSCPLISAHPEIQTLTQLKLLIWYYGIFQQTFSLI